MKKIVRKIGKATGMIFTKEEMKIYNISIGKIFDIELSEVRVNERKKI